MRANPQVPTCTTSSGPRPGQSCVFPFRHLGIVYNACTSVGQAAPWCSTSTTRFGIQAVIMVLVAKKDVLIIVCNICRTG